MVRPVVGITTYVVPASFGVWQLDAALVPHDYVLAVERAGGRPLLVPPSPDGVEETLDSVDGLIFSGGSDLDPDLYGQAAHPETKDVVRARDDAELALLRGALGRDLPVLAICRAWKDFDPRKSQPSTFMWWVAVREMQDRTRRAQTRARSRYRRHHHYRRNRERDDLHLRSREVSCRGPEE